MIQYFGSGKGELHRFDFLTESTTLFLDQERPFGFTDIEFRDLNGDGLKDLVSATGNLGIETRLQGANGSFLSPTLAEGPVNQAEIHFADFDLDGDQDLAVNAMSFGNSQILLFSNENDEFALEEIIDSNLDAQEIIVTDLDNDQYPDIVGITVEQKNAVDVIWNDIAGPPPTSIKTLNQPDIHISPNPAREQINVQIPEGLENVELSIFNSKGQVIHQYHDFSDQSIDVSGLAEGLYRMVLHSGSLRHEQELVIIR